MGRAWLARNTTSKFVHSMYGIVMCIFTYNTISNRTNTAGGHLLKHRMKISLVLQELSLLNTSQTTRICSMNTEYSTDPTQTQCLGSQCSSLIDISGIAEQNGKPDAFAEPMGRSKRDSRNGRHLPGGVARARARQKISSTVLEWGKWSCIFYVIYGMRMGF